MLRHVRLLKDTALFWIKARGKHIERHIVYCLAESFSVVISRCESVKVGDKKEAFVSFLDLDPVAKRSQIIAKMNTTGGLNTGDYNWDLTKGHMILIIISFIIVLNIRIFCY